MLRLIQQTKKKKWRKFLHTKDTEVYSPIIVILIKEALVVHWVRTRFLR